LTDMMSLPYQVAFLFSPKGRYGDWESVGMFWSPYYKKSEVL
jgi:hypothetical protein